MNWFEVKIKTMSDAKEAMIYSLEQVGIEGVIILDPNDEIYSESYEGDWDYIDDSVRQFDFEDTFLTGYIEETVDIRTIVSTLESDLEELKNRGFDIGEGQVTYSVVNDEDWANEWKKYFKPLKISDNIVIKPTWEAYEKEGNEVIIEIDPGSAFGSGTHETTANCVLLIDKYFNKTKTAFDIGCGTGILGIAAAKLGAEKVLAVDIAEDAITATNENIEINEVGHIMTAHLGDLTDVITGKADMVIANIIAPIIIMLSETVGDYLEDDGIFISSGIINGKLEDVKEALIKNNFEIVEVITEGEWSAVAAKKAGV